VGPLNSVSTAEASNPRDPADESGVLPLSDTAGDSGLSAPSGSTPSGGGSSVAGSGRDDDASGSATAAGTASGSAADAVGGFDTMLGRLVVQSGIATAEEVAGVEADLETANGRTFADLLVEREFATRHQINRLRQDFEARSSGRSIPGYRLKKKLGAGAMAQVFLAKQVSLDRLVAIKILPTKFSKNTQFIDRFYKEGRAAAQLNHPNIVAAYDVGAVGDHHYFVMEYVDGPTVHDHIVEHKRYGEREALEIVLQVAKALEHAHERGFIHRDIKPKNIMITKRGRVKLADLGLARAVSDKEAAQAEAGRAYGTPYYISPEQIRGEVDIGPPADIYGLGATFYHMVTGRVPFSGRNPSEVMHRHLKEELEPPDHVNPELGSGCAQVIEMMMAKKREDRYRSVADLIEDLQLVLDGQPPHFAHRSFDHSAITETLTSAVTAPVAEAPPVLQPRGGGANQWPLLLGSALAISVLVNLLLLAIVLFG